MLTSLGRSPVDLSIGTFCHENGHQLCRFPDLYDYGQRDGDFEKSQGLGGYCLMGSGNHNNRGRTPSPICSYLRYLAGWYEEEVLLNAAKEYAVPHGAYGTAFKFETDRQNEFFLVENRSRIGLDEPLPASGLAVYHCDTLGSNEWQGGTAEKHYQCGLLQADGHLDLENNRNRGDAGDLFGERPGVALSDATTPSSRMWDGSGSGLVIRDISPPGETVRFVTGASREAASVQADRVADALIPDNDPKGIASGLLISPSGKLTKIEVEVHITHSYVSDLQVELVAPGGRQAMLHDRMGGSGDDLLETFTSSSPGSLQGLAGVEIAGEWRLLVRDLAGQDQGRLNSWGLALEYEPSGEEIRAEATPGLDIPDNDPEGAMSRMEIEASGSLLEPVVGVDVRHTFVGDLLLELIAPGGETAVLHSRSGGGQNNLNMSYDLGNTQSLQALVGTEIKGVWRLRVRDMARFDEGRLERWSLQLRYR
jgi:subtilisin-like proprotein convertase family protein